MKKTFTVIKLFSNRNRIIDRFSFYFKFILEGETDESVPNTRIIETLTSQRQIQKPIVPPTEYRKTPDLPRPPVVQKPKVNRFSSLSLSLFLLDQPFEFLRTESCSQSFLSDEP